MNARAAIVLASLLAACGAGAPAPRTATTAAATPEIRWIEDRYDAALAEGRAKHKPIFVDTWASWCHSCLSLRQFVFPDPKIRARAGDFVWLAIDTEKPEAEAFMRTHPMSAWPTLWVIDPATERPLLKWVGSATPDELGSLLDDAKLAFANGTAEGEAGAAYLVATQEAAAGKAAEAIESFRHALSVAPPGWPRRARAAEALSTLLRTSKNHVACLDLAAQELPTMAKGTSAKNVALDALLCLTEVPDSERRPREEALLAAAERIARDPSQPILVDDRSELYEQIVDTLDTLEKKDQARKIAAEWAALIEPEAARAKTPADRAVFDAHRYEAYLALGQPERAIPMLEASARDFPNDFNPPARLAGALLAMKRYDEALAQIDRALSLANGPRKLRLFTTKADICAAKGDKAGEKAAVEAALAHANGLVLMGGATRVRDALVERRKKLQ